MYEDTSGSPAVKCTTAAITPAPAGIGIPTKYFFPGRPGLDGCGFAVILNLARRLTPATRNKKLAMAPTCAILLTNSGEARIAGSSRKPHIQASNAGATPN